MHTNSALLFPADDTVALIEDAVEVAISEDGVVAVDELAEVATDELLLGNTTAVSELEDDITGVGFVERKELDTFPELDSADETLSLEELFSTGVAVIELLVAILLAVMEDSVLLVGALLLPLLLPEPPQAINTLENKISALGFSPAKITSAK